jgi:hypothetical protein
MLSYVLNILPPSWWLPYSQLRSTSDTIPSTPVILDDSEDWDASNGLYSDGYVVYLGERQKHQLGGLQGSLVSIRHSLLSQLEPYYSTPGIRSTLPYCHYAPQQYYPIPSRPNWRPPIAAPATGINLISRVGAPLTQPPSLKPP